MEGITNPERTALGVSLDSGPTEGAPCREPLEGGSEGRTDWPCVPGAVDNPPGGVWIDFIRRTVGDSQSIVAVPVTVLPDSPTLFSRRDADFGYIYIQDIV